MSFAGAASMSLAAWCWAHNDRCEVGHPRPDRDSFRRSGTGDPLLCCYAAAGREGSLP